MPHLSPRHTSRLAALATATVLPLTLVGLAPGGAAARELRGDGHTYTTQVTDPDDTAGRLDIARVRHRVTSDTRGQHVTVAFRVRTFKAFDATALHPHRRSLVIELDTDGQRGAERNLRISAHDGEPVAELISNATRRVIARLPMMRPDRRTVVVTAGRKRLGARQYFWTATYHRPTSPQCGSGGGYPVWCQDTVPQRGWIRMDRPAWPRQ